MFYYSTGKEVHKGDIILWARRKAVVEFIIQPKTQDAIDYDVLDGGIMLSVDWEGGEKNSILEIPDNGIFDEDVEFLRRGNEMEAKDQNS